MAPLTRISSYPKVKEQYSTSPAMQKFWLTVMDFSTPARELFYVGWEKGLARPAQEFTETHILVLGRWPSIQSMKIFRETINPSISLFNIAFN